MSVFHSPIRCPFYFNRDILAYVTQYLPDAEPFSRAGNATGCLLIHGFTGTPYEVRGLGDFLHQRRGYTVSGPALAGHATRFEDILETTWHDWYESVTKAYDALALECDEIFAIGLSLGAALALHLAAHRPLSGVVAAAAPYEVKRPLVTLFRTFPVLMHVVPHIGKDNKHDDTQDPTVRPIHPHYDRSPVRAGASLIQDFLPHLRSDLRDIRVPALMLQSPHDRAVPRSSMEDFYVRLGSSDKRMVWIDRGGHLMFEDYGKEQAFAQVDEFILAHRRNRT